MDLATVDVIPSTAPSKLQLLAMSGKSVNVYAIARYTSTYTLSLVGITPGMYKLIWTDGRLSKLQTLIVE